MLRKTLYWLACICLILSIGSCQSPKNLLHDEITTLNSLARVSEYPLYTMHYQGKYSSGVSELPIQETSQAWACSLFAALGDKDNQLFGRNFDWQYSPAVLLFTNPPDGYASVSMVDIAYLGYDNQTENLAELPIEKRKALLHAPLIPFDGMNEYGLAIAMAAVPESKMPYDSSKPTIDSAAIMREILDHARTVDEAVAIFGKYNIEWGSGPALHYLIAEAGSAAGSPGKSVLVEFYDGKMVVIPNGNPWNLATNHLRVIAQGNGGCERYAKMNQRLTDSSGKITDPDALQLLEDVSQVGDYPTQWSIIYGINTGEIRVAMGREYDQTYTFQLPMASK